MRRRTRKNRKLLKLFLKIVVAAIILAALLAIVVVTASVLGLIDTSANLDRESMQLNYASIVYYTDSDTGEDIEYQRLYEEENRIWVGIDKIPKDLQEAVVSIEDERFYKHHGVDLLSTSKAVVQYLTTKDGRGASTITQQLVKNLTGDNEVKVSRKVTEIIRALNIERKLSKEEILEMYLNTIYLSNSCHGVASASDLFFDKDVSELDLAECALLAGITQYPSLYDPINNFESSKEKQEVVLAKMLELGKITQQEHDDAVAEKLDIHAERSRQLGGTQNYFIDQIINDVISDLVSECGYTESMALKMVYNGGLKIYSTVDPSVQETMESVYEDTDNFPAYKDDPAPQSAMIVLDPSTNAIKGIVGGIGVKEASRTLNRASQSLRQPGSTIKPIGVYGPAFDEGIITPNTRYVDEKITIKNWSPKNYYSGYRGIMTVKYAIEQSVNTVAVQVLQDLGIEKSFDFMTDKLGISSLVESRKTDDGSIITDMNLSSLALGGLTDGISPKELGAAYSAFANEGVYNKPHSYTKVVDQSGATILSNEKQKTVAMEEETARLMCALLHSVVTNGTGTAANFRSDIEICGKTGTTDDDVDRWFVGYTPYYVGVVWYGFDMPKPINFLRSNPTIPVWTKVMKQIHQGLPAKSFKSPKKYSDNQLYYCKDSGCIATDLCRLDPRGSRAVPGEPKTRTQCTLHKSVIVDSSTGMLATNKCPTENVKTIVYTTSPTYDGEPVSQHACSHGGELLSNSHSDSTDGDSDSSNSDSDSNKPNSSTDHQTSSPSKPNTSSGNGSQVSDAPVTIIP